MRDAPVRRSTGGCSDSGRGVVGGSWRALGGVGVGKRVRLDSQAGTACAAIAPVMRCPQHLLQGRIVC